METRSEGFRLSPQQRRAWLLAQASPVYQAGCAVSLVGKLEVSRLRRALDAVVARHESLRTTFHRVPGVKVPIQVVEPSGGAAWREVDLAAGSGGREQEALVDEIFQAELATPPAFERGPLLRAGLIRLGPDRHVLTLVLPSLATDDTGLRWLLHELTEIYAGNAESLPAEEDLVQYVQFSEWQHELRESEEGEDGRSFWSARPAAEGAVELGLENWRGGDAPFTPSSRLLTLTPEVTAGVERVAASLELTVADLLLGAWITLLGRTSERSALAVEVAFDGRSYDELQQTIGLYRKTIPVACQLPWASPFAELASRVSGAVAELAAWQDTFPVADEPSRSAVAFELTEWPTSTTVDGLSVSPLRFGARTEPYKLALIGMRRPQGWAAEIGYDTSCFVPHDIDRLALKLERLLAAISADPRTRLADLDLLSDAERRELLVRFNATARDYPRDRTFHELFAEQAARTPDRAALRHAGEELTYRELAERVRHFAGVLRQEGVGPDERVAVCLERSFDLVVTLLAVLEAGGAYVPIDPLYPPERMAFMMGDARVCLGVTQKRFLSGLPAGTARFLTVGEELGKPLDGPSPPAPRVDPANLAYVLYTSGSTGRPKGVMVPHRGVVNYLSWAIAAYRLSESGSAPVHSPVGFDLTVTSLFGPLLSGGCAVLVPEERGIEGLSLELGQGGELSLLKLTPSFLEVINQLLDQEQLKGRTRALVLGGEALSGRSLLPWRTAAPETRLINEYGPTETVVGCAVFEVGAGDDLPASVPIGRPIANTRLYLLDARLRPLPSGITGHLHVAGEGLARGYLDRPALTAERFIPAPFDEGRAEPGSRLYRTGDLARFRSDGELEFLGRIDQQIKIRGYRIEPGEVEATLLLHPGVEAAAVVASGDAVEERRLVAYVVADEELARGSELRSFLVEKLPEYMIPTAFVPLTALPLTPNGKVDRAALPQLDPQRPELRAPYVAPRTPVEEILAAIWPQVLGLDSVGTDDNFFALGGDSIRSVRAVALAKERGIEYSVEQLLRFQTIRELAREVKTFEASSIPAVRVQPFSMVRPADRELLPAGAEDAYPLTALQAGMLYHMQLDNEYPLYHNVNTWHLRAPFEREIFLAALREVISRHPVLRTSFDFTSYSEPLQIVHRSAELKVGFDDLRDLDPEEQHRVLEEFWERERRQIFDLVDHPYFRLHFHRRSEDTFQFTLIESHAILDGWSTTSTLAEIFVLFFTLLSGRTPRIERPLATSFADYVSMERATLESEECREYWERHLAGVEPSPLPRWPQHLRGDPEARQGKLYIDVPQPSLEALRAIARSMAVPLRSVLLAVHLKMLSWATGRRDVLSGVVTNGRPEQLDGERVRGLFLNTLPFHFTLRDGSWADLVRDVFETERIMLPFRRYPMASLQQRWGRRRLFDAAFTFLHFHSVERLLREQAVEILEDDERDFSFNSFLLNVTFFLSPILDRIRIILEYDGVEICREQVGAIGEAFLRIIDRMIADPLARHGEDPLLSEGVRRQILEEWSGARRVLAVDETLPALFATQVACTPRETAVVCGGESLTYAELAAQAYRLAHVLRARGLAAEQPVGVCLDRSLALVVSLLGVLAAGGAYVPLDPALPQERLDYLADDALGKGGLVVTAGSLAHRFSGRTVLAVDAETDALAAAPATAPGLDVTVDNLAYIIYTSGSTGKPKGVAVTHANIVRLFSATAERFAFGADDVWTLFHSYAFDFSVWELWGALLHGGRLVVVPYEVSRSPEAFYQLLVTAGVTVLNQTPTAFGQLIAAEEAETGARNLALRWVIFGGEALNLTSLAPWLARHGDTSPRLVNMYGITETTVHTTLYDVGFRDLEEASRSPIGQPLADTRLFLLDPALRPVPVGAVGELFVGGPSLARAYWGRPGLTAERFIPDPLSGEEGARLYRSGDLASYRADGNLEYLGRTDNQVKVRGFRIELGEIETALYRLPEVREAAAASYKDETTGEAFLAAFLVPARQEQALPSTAELRSHLLRSLPEYMVPAVFVPLTVLPLTASGKVDRSALPTPSTLRRQAGTTIVPPRTEFERTLATIWQEILKTDAVGIHDSFFDLGGNSLRLFELSTKLREAWKARPIQLIDLMRYPTIASLSEYLSTEQAPVALAEVDERTAKLRRGRDQLSEQFARARRAPR